MAQNQEREGAKRGNSSNQPLSTTLDNTPCDSIVLLLWVSTCRMACAHRFTSGSESDVKAAAGSHRRPLSRLVVHCSVDFDIADKRTYARNASQHRGESQEGASRAPGAERARREEHSPSPRVHNHTHPFPNIMGGSRGELRAPVEATG